MKNYNNKPKQSTQQKVHEESFLEAFKKKNSLGAHLGTFKKKNSLGAYLEAFKKKNSLEAYEKDMLKKEAQILEDDIREAEEQLKELSSAEYVEKFRKSNEGCTNEVYYTRLCDDISDSLRRIRESEGESPLEF